MQDEPIKRNVTLDDGRALDKHGKICTAPVAIQLDDTNDAQGRPITFELFRHIVSKYNNQKSIKQDTKIKVAYVIDKQLLQILLSSKDCTGLLLCKCLRPSEKDPSVDEESIAFLAVTTGIKPVTSHNQEGKRMPLNDQSPVPAGEWIHGLTVKEELDRGIISRDTDPLLEFNFDSYLKTLSQKASKIL